MPLHQIGSNSSYKRSQERSLRHETKESLHTRPNAAQSVLERCSSLASTLTFNEEVCRICQCEAEDDSNLISPCNCAGSLRFVHQECLQQWIKSSDIKCCELCKFPFVMETKTKPFTMWEKLDMASSERCKLLFSVMLHVATIACTVFTMCTLTDRITREVRSGSLEWTLWAKLILMATCVTVVAVFLYVQSKTYLQLFRRWRAYNRVIFVQNMPFKVAPVVDLESGRNQVSSSCYTGSPPGEAARPPPTSFASQSSVGSEERCGQPVSTHRPSPTVHVCRSSRAREDSDVSAASVSLASDRLAAEAKRRYSDVHGRVLVTVERSRSSSPMLPSCEQTGNPSLP